MIDNILVTGGAGYIGSHTCVELLQAGYRVSVVDNLSNSKLKSIERIETIAKKKVNFYPLDIRHKAAMAEVFAGEKFDAVIHFAGLKAVGESCEQPLSYYDNNFCGTVALTEVMAEAGVRKVVFSSSATVYGDPHTVPITENFPLTATNPYGRSKLMIEDFFRDLAAADRQCKATRPWKIALLRYFNPIGAHSSGLIGEDPNGIPNNLMPYVSQVAIGRLKQLAVFGDDYPTPDGTGVRDYIHVVDLAKGHLKALQALAGQRFKQGDCKAYNLGTGNGYSVLQLIRTFEKVTGQKINYKIAPRRAGDIAACYADPGIAENELDWRAEKNLEDMVADSWRWQKQNPHGFE